MSSIQTTTADGAPTALTGTGPAKLVQKVVLVTGAAKRLGREIALLLAKSGWAVAVHYRSSAADALQTVADCQCLGASAAAFEADLADEAETNALLSRVVAHFGRVDAIVNSASTFELDQAETFSYGALNRHMHANAGAAIVLARDLHAHLVARDSAPPVSQPGGESAAIEPTPANSEGCVVNLLDQKLWNPNPDFFSYTLSKAALEAASTMLALALAPRVRVVGVAPGLTLTSHMLSDEQFATLHKLGPLGRGSAAQDVAASVRFALDNRSITGTTLLVDAGQHLQRFPRDFSLM